MVLEGDAEAFVLGHTPDARAVLSLFLRSIRP